MLIIFLIAATFSSCSKNNDEITSEAQTNAFNIDNVKKGQLNGQEITYERKNGINFFQGDIVLTDKQLSEGSELNKGGASFSRWPNGKIYYTIASNIALST